LTLGDEGMGPDFEEHLKAFEELKAVKDELEK